MKKFFYGIALLLVHSSLLLAQTQFLRIYTPDIEQGAATLIVAPTGNAMLIDAGTEIYETDIHIEAFINDLKDQGVITSLDYTATHYDEDHIGRMEKVYQYVSLPSGFIAYDRGTAGSLPTSFAYSDYAYYAGLNNRTTVTATTVINLGGGVTVTCYVVNGDLPDSTNVDLSTTGSFENASSAAFVVSYGDLDYWIGGDLVGNTDWGLAAVEQGVASFVGDVDIYAVNHHGSRSSSTASFLSTIKAEVAINQNSAGNSHGHPNIEVVNAFHAALDTNGNTPTWLQTNPGKPGDVRTDDTLADGIADPDDVSGPTGFLPGTITLVSDGGSYQIYGGSIEPISSLVDSGTHTMADFPPAILEHSYSPLIPTASQTTTVEAEVRDDGTVTASLTYEVNDVAQTAIAMTLNGTTNRYEGTIPAQLDGSKVTFRVEVTDNLSQLTKSDLTGYFSGTTDIGTVKEQDSNGILLTDGYLARIKGNLSVEASVFHPTVSQIYAQDSTGGINIFHSSLVTAVLGDEITFSGRLEQFGGMAQMVIAGGGEFGYNVDASGTTPAATLITLAQLDETVEGKLVRVENLTVVSGSIPESGNGSITVTDDGGVTNWTMKVDEDTDIPGSNTPASSFDLVGLANQYDSSVPYNWGYQITPRQKTDIESDEVNHSAVVISEIHADPDATSGDANGDGNISSTQDEFIELVNTSYADVDISSWTLSDLTGVALYFPK